ncbi:MAG: hypothetical protein B6245_16130 [Desulfobacteraceae bacterium 4572_88]|nr:MAG: hypothetical protein B6245_16130 [Desulfobacteraceae bacterium 4572_88]
MNTFRGKTVYSDAQHLHVELEDGRVISTPMEWYEDLQKASPDQLSDYQFICQNTGIEWSETGFPSRRASGNPISTEGLSPGDKSPG